MKRLMRRLSRVADSSGYRPLRPGGKEDGRQEVPEGHVPVCVGEEMERFEVRAELLGRPVFVELLARSAQEYGYEQRGVLRIPCSVPLFNRVLRSLLSPDGGSETLSADDLESEFAGDPSTTSSCPP